RDSSMRRNGETPSVSAAATRRESGAAEQVEVLASVYYGFTENPTEQTRTNVLTGMDRDDRLPAIRMSQFDVATSLTHHLKPLHRQKPYQRSARIGSKRFAMSGRHEILRREPRSLTPPLDGCRSVSLV